MTIYSTFKEAQAVANATVTPEMKAQILAGYRTVIQDSLSRAGKVIMPATLITDAFYQHPTDGPLPVFPMVTFTKDDL